MNTLDVALIGPGYPRWAGMGTVDSVMEGPLFEAALQYARASFDVVYTLSPEHVLISLEQVVLPSSTSLLLKGPAYIYLWGKRVVSTLRTRHPLQRLSIQILASRLYARPITYYLESELLLYWDWGEPLHDLSYAERLAWFESQKENPDV